MWSEGENSENSLFSSTFGTKSATGHYYCQNFAVFHQFSLKIGVWGCLSKNKISKILLIS